MKTKNTLGAILGCVLLAAGSAQADYIDSDWTNFTAGTNQWNTVGNWTSSSFTNTNWFPISATVPNNAGTNFFVARIMNGTSNDITVETSGSVTLFRLWLERTNTGSVTLKLGGNMTVTGDIFPKIGGNRPAGTNMRYTGFSNSIANSPGSLVVDLNSNTFDSSGASADNVLANSRNYTVRDTSTNGNGTYILRNVASGSGQPAGTVNIENKVTVKLSTYDNADFRNSAGSASDPGWVFSKDSTLWFSADGGAAKNLYVGGSEFGNVIVGSATNASASIYSLGSGDSSLYVKGNLTLLAGSAITMDTTAGVRAKRKIILEGNLTDTNATGTDYGGRADGGGGVFFVGGTNKVQEVLVKRSGLTSLFSVGDSNALGSVKLLNNLTTTLGTNANSVGTGQLMVWENSKFDVGQFTLQATTVTINSSANLAFTFGNNTSNALIKATNVLTLNGFNLILNYDGGGWSSGDIKLFEYGTKSGTPVVSSLVATNGLEGTLVDRTNSIWFVPDARFWASGAGGGGSGTWSAAGTNWSAMTGLQGGAAQSTNRTLIFRGTAGTVTIDGTVSATNGLQFSTDGYVLQGGTALALSGLNISSNTITTDTGVGVAINSALTGTKGLTKAGDGTLTLGGANTYSGGTIVSSGKLVGDSTSLQGNITNNATLAFNQATNGTYAGALSGSGLLSKGGSGSLTLSGANNYTGGTLISGGTLVGTTTSLQGNITNNSAAAFNQATNGAYAGALSGSGLLIKDGSGTVTLSGANSYSGGTLVSAGRLIGDTVSLQGNITNNASVAFDQSTNGTYSGVISGTGLLVKTNSGEVTLSGANSYSGNTLVAGGRLIGDTTSLQGAITNNASVTFSQTTNGTYSGVMSGTGSLVKSGSGSLTLSGANSYSGGTLVSGGSLIGDTTSLKNAITNNAVVIFDQATPGTYSGVMSGTGLLTKIGGGVLTLSGANSYSGGTLISSGALVGTTTSLQGNITDNATLRINQTTNGTYSGNISGTGSLDKRGSGTVTLTGENSYTGGTTLADAGSALIGDTRSLQGSFSVGKNLTVTIDQATNGTFNGYVTGNGILIKSGSGTVSMYGSNNYAGGTLVSGGNLVGDTTSLRNAITNNAAVTYNQATNGTYAGVMEGTGALFKNGVGTTTFTGDNTFTGATTVSAGTLQLNSASGSALGGTTNVSVAANAILLLSKSDQVNNSASVTLSGGTIKRETGVSETFGDLNLTSASFLDFGSGTEGTLQFGTYTPSALLTVNNFFKDNKLVFSSNIGSDINNTNLFAFSGAFTTNWDGSTFTITAIPEPSAYAAAAGLIGLMLVSLRRRAKGALL